MLLHQSLKVIALTTLFWFSAMVLMFMSHDDFTRNSLEMLNAPLYHNDDYKLMHEVGVEPLKPINHDIMIHRFPLIHINYNFDLLDLRTQLIF